MSEPINELHKAWCQATGQQLHPRASERIMFELFRADVKPDDITIVVKHLQKQNRNFGSGVGFRMNLQKVAGDVETFLCLVAEARATLRNHRPAPTEKEKVIEQFRPSANPELDQPRAKGNGVHISEVFKRMQ